MLLLLKQTPGTVAPPQIEERPENAGFGPRIRCPRCGWQPGKGDRWMCTCLHIWNTFDTRGVCPACGRAWQETQCRRCGQWSPHDEWYVEDPGEAQ